MLGVLYELGDELGRLFAEIGFGQVQASDLEAVEEQAGAARVDVIGGDLLKHKGEGVLDGGAVFRDGEGEAGLAAARRGVPDGAAGMVVELSGFPRFGGLDKILGGV